MDEEGGGMGDGEKEEGKEMLTEDKMERRAQKDNTSPLPPTGAKKKWEEGKGNQTAVQTGGQISR